MIKKYSFAILTLYLVFYVPAYAPLLRFIVVANEQVPKHLPANASINFSAEPPILCLQIFYPVL